MTVPALSAAKRLCEKDGWTLTNLHIQKLLYIAHMFFLGQKDGEPLVTGHFEAWAFGPVHPEVYHAAKVCRGDPVVPDVFSLNESLPDDSAEVEYLDEALEKLPLKKLVAITHWEGGAWHNLYEPYSRGIIISNVDILQEYRAREDAAKEKR